MGMIRKIGLWEWSRKGKKRVIKEEEVSKKKKKGSTSLEIQPELVKGQPVNNVQVDPVGGAGVRAFLWA